MRTFLAAVLGVIAVGVLLIAYGLLSPRSVTADSYPLARPVLANDRIGLDGAAAGPVSEQQKRYAAKIWKAVRR